MNFTVGGGSAGSVAAYRLSEFYDVLLLEAGGEMNDFQQIPAMSLLMLNYPEIDWSHKTVPQRHACYGSPRNVCINFLYLKCFSLQTALTRSYF